MRLSSFSRSSADGGRGKRQRMIQGGLLAAVLVLAIYAVYDASSSSEEAADEILLKDRAGGEHNLNLSDGKVKLINIWASWCVPCQKEIPVLDKLFQTYKKEVDFYAVHATRQDTVYEAVNFQLKMKMKTPVYFDEKGEAEEYFKLKSIPTTILVDQDGKKHFIYGPLEKTEVEGLLEAYLSR
ncbi:Thiol-disulfide oxidoreductase ResA [Paenibacillus sp. P22]|nr:Thiol-disulfide oxidoreductase ResA [Paenibacillus sp. P22]